MKNLIAGIFSAEKIALKRLNYIFCSDKYLLKMNKKYLGHDFYTDVISFPLSSAEEPVLGEVYLSADRIKENAKNYNVTYQKELLRVIIHGALHFCGFKDETAAQKKIMHQREDFYIKIFNSSFT